MPLLTPTARGPLAGVPPNHPDTLAKAICRDVPALVVSLVVHCGVLVGLALVGSGVVSPLSGRTPLLEVPAVTEEEPPPLLAMIATDEPQPPGAQGSQRTAEIAQSLAPVLAEISIPTVDLLPEEPVSSLSVEPPEALPTALAIDATVVVRGAASAVTTGAAGAVDRLTAEIVASLGQRPTLVCWLFDRSVSLSAQRQEIALRLQRVFEELGANRSARHRPDLTNMLIAYGKDLQLLTPKPTDDTAEVVQLIESVAVDDSGIEMTFTAILAAAEAARVFRTSVPKRNVMIVVFTDEVGNDDAAADQTGQLCRTLGIPVFVVGVPAPFGMREVRMKYVEFDPAFAPQEQWAVVEQGPETLAPEVVRVRSGSLADEAIDSGFGPYGLAKLCAETGGTYFAIHANRNHRGRVTNRMTAPMASQLRYFFDADVMLPYQPEYVSAAKYRQELGRNAAKQALVEAARSSEISPMESPRLVFPKKDDGDLAGLLGEAQKTAARIQPQIDRLYAVLAAGLPARESIRERRWQAGFDLALGRVLAVKVRTDAYNLMLAQAKQGMQFEDPGHDTWALEPSAEVVVGSQTEKLAAQAKTLLERVQAEHPGTPWALLAGEELKLPLGYRWTETFTGVNVPKENGTGGGTPQPPNDDERTMLGAPKPKRNLKAL